MKIQSVIIAVLFFLNANAQYDAVKLQSLYGQTVKAELLLNQLKTEAAISHYFTYDAKARIRLQKNMKRFETCLDSMVINLPGENPYKKLFLKIKNKWELYKGLLSKNKITEDDWKQIEKLQTSLNAHLSDMEAALLLLLSPTDDVLNTVEKLKVLNEKVSGAFFYAIMEKSYKKPPVSIDNKIKMIEEASKKIKKVQSFFKKDESMLFRINTMKSDLNTFHMGFKNDYNPGVLVSTYEKFNGKIFKIHKKLFENYRFY
jgi:hypothetical protein